MTVIGFFVGPETREPSEAWEDPSATLRLAALTASWLSSRGDTLLVLGDAPALLAVGTSVLGTQESRVLEGGERRDSPIRVLSLLEGDTPELDRALGFRRRPKEAPFEDRERPLGEEPSWGEELFGDLSLLVEVGIMDVAREGRNGLDPQSAEMTAQILRGQLQRERPSAVLAFGALPGAVTDVTRSFALEMKVPFGSVAGRNEGADLLISEPGPPMLDGLPLRFREDQDLGREGPEELQETADEELMEIARYGTWEAEMTYTVYRWIQEIERGGGG